MPKFLETVGNFLTGTPAKYKRRSIYEGNQQDLANQAVNAGLNPGAGGAFGDAADYYRNNLSDNPSDFNAFAAPALRQYNEDIVPGLSEQFAGMGSGGLSSSGFRNAQIQGATDLSERLGAIRANLRQQSAQGLQSIGQQGLVPQTETVQTEGATQGFLPAAAQAASNFLTPSIAQTGMNLLNGLIPKGNTSSTTNTWGGNKVGGNSSPYGSNQMKASPQIGGQGLQLPNFMQRQ